MASWINLMEIVYPVGAYYISSIATSPATLFGGTWETIPAGHFITAAGAEYAVNAKGGASIVTLTVAQIPPHNHSFTKISGMAGSKDVGGGASWGDFSYPTTSTGGGQAHENRPLFIAAYIWKRTA